MLSLKTSSEPPIETANEHQKSVLLLCFAFGFAVLATLFAFVLSRFLGLHTNSRVSLAYNLSSLEGSTLVRHITLTSPASKQIVRHILSNSCGSRAGTVVQHP